MRYYPIFLDLKEKKVFLAGGGKVALRKAETLLKAGAQITLSAPRILKTLANLPGVTCLKKDFDPRDLTCEYALVIAATSDPGINRRVADKARELKIPVNVVDVPELSSFIVPALLEKGDLQLAISSSGQAPGFSAWLRKEFSRELGPQTVKILTFLGNLRKNPQYLKLTPEQKRAFWKQVHQLQLLENLRAKNYLKLKKQIEELWNNAG